MKVVPLWDKFFMIFRQFFGMKGCTPFVSAYLNYAYLKAKDRYMEYGIEAHLLSSKDILNVISI